MTSFSLLPPGLLPAAKSSLLKLQLKQKDRPILPIGLQLCSVLLCSIQLSTSRAHIVSYRQVLVVIRSY